MGTAFEADEIRNGEIIINEHYRILNVPGVGQLLVNRHDLTLPGSIMFERQEIAELLPAVHGTVLDIGANIGAHTICFARKAQTVYAIEPHPHTFKVMEANIVLNGLTNVITYNCAIGEYDRDALILPIDPVKDHSSQGACIADYGEPVKVRKLDSFHFTGLDFIKIDVEGMELEVLRGGEQILRKGNPIVYVEIHEEPLVEAIGAFMSNLGYQGTERIVQHLTNDKVLTRGWLFWKGGKIKWV